MAIKSIKRRAVILKAPVMISLRMCNLAPEATNFLLIFFNSPNFLSHSHLLGPAQTKGYCTTQMFSAKGSNLCLLFNQHYCLS